MASWSLGRVVGLVPIVLSFALISASDPDFEPRVHSSFTLDLIAGAERLRGSSTEGMLEVDNAWGSQLLYWSEAKTLLEDSAKHERSLMIRASRDGAHVVDEAFEAADTPGRGSLSWSAKLEETQFRASMVDCISHHVLLTTTGPSDEDVRRVHERTLRSMKCRVPRPPRPTVAAAPSAPKPPSVADVKMPRTAPAEPAKASPSKPEPSKPAAPKREAAQPPVEDPPAAKPPAKEPAPKPPAEEPAPKAPEEAPKEPAPKPPAEAPQAPKPKPPAEDPKPPAETPPAEDPAPEAG